MDASKERGQPDETSLNVIIVVRPSAFKQAGIPEPSHEVRDEDILHRIFALGNWIRKNHDIQPLPKLCRSRCVSPPARPSRQMN